MSDVHRGAQCAWQIQNPGPADTPLPGTPNPVTGTLEFTIPFGTGKAPGITGRVRFVVVEWNA